MPTRFLWPAFLVLTVAQVSHAATTGDDAALMYADVAYGPAAANKLDLWHPKSAVTTAVVVYFHGWGSEDKSSVRRDGMLGQLLAAGISVASADYRDRKTGGTFPQGLHDCARAVQFIRAHAKQFNIDPRRVAAFGGSFGGTAALWLAFHDDMADPRASDRVLRQSTRLICAGATSAQVSLDPIRWTRLFSEDVIDRFGAAYKDPQLWGCATLEELLGPAGKKVRDDCDLIGLISKDDPPVFLIAHRPNRVTSPAEFVHHPKLTQALYQRCREVGVAAIADIPALGIEPAADEPKTAVEFAVRYLGQGEPKTADCYGARYQLNRGAKSLSNLRK